MAETDTENPQPAELSAQSYERETQRNLLDARGLDFEILEYSDVTRQLVELGLESLNEVTEKYGTTKQPKEDL